MGKLHIGRFLKNILEQKVDVMVSFLDVFSAGPGSLVLYKASGMLFLFFFSPIS